MDNIVCGRCSVCQIIQLKKIPASDDENFNINISAGQELAAGPDYIQFSFLLAH